MSGSAAPGWYHAQGDPPGTERLWDGTAWIEGPRPIGGDSRAASSDIDTSGDTTVGSSAPPVGFGSPPPDTLGGTADFGAPAPHSAAPAAGTGFAPPTAPPNYGFPGAPVPAAGGVYFAEQSKATTALICSIVGAVLSMTVIGGIIGLPLAIVGAVMGNTERNAIKGGRRDPANRGKAMTALIIGAVVAVLGVLAILGTLLAVIALA